MSSYILPVLDCMEFWDFRVNVRCESFIRQFDTENNFMNCNIYTKNYCNVVEFHSKKGKLMKVNKMCTEVGFDS